MSHSKRNSGHPKQKWTHEEEQALRMGVKSYGVGKWRLIQKDDVCGPVLANRSNVDLKDKWRNLNMEAKEREAFLGDTDDDPDFKREVNRRKRKKRRSSAEIPSDEEQPQAQHMAKSNSPEEDMQQVTSAAVLAEEVTGSEQRQSWPPPGSLHAAQPNLQDSPDVSPSSKGGPIVDDMVVAAVISLQDPGGSGADDICIWIEEHYPAVDRDQVKAVMSDMVQAGRLQHVPNNPFLVRMGGVVRKLEEQRGLPRSLHEHAHDEHEGQRQGNGVIDDKMVADHAMLAAQAVADAEEASKKASSLLRAANELEDLHHRNLQARHVCAEWPCTEGPLTSVS
ncbi:hypothetical protein WJX79_003314 [Trebouxia sp. C0005]